MLQLSVGLLSKKNGIVKNITLVNILVISSHFIDYERGSTNLTAYQQMQCSISGKLYVLIIIQDTREIILEKIMLDLVQCQFAY